jgi:hypothetical protein
MPSGGEGILGKAFCFTPTVKHGEKGNTMPYLEPGQPVIDEDMFLDPCDTPREGWVIGDYEPGPEHPLYDDYQQSDTLRQAGIRMLVEDEVRRDDPAYWPEDTNENPPVRG